MKVAIVCAKGLNSFTRGIGSVLARKHDVREYLVTTGAEVAQADAWADVVWCEWANDVAAFLSEHGKKPLVVRMHRYEAWTGLVQKVKWQRVAALISTSKHVLATAKQAVPDIDERTKCYIIPSGIDLSLWPVQKHTGANKRVGVVSFVHGRKQPGLWLQVLAALPQEYHLHQIGAVQQPEWTPYLKHVASRLGLAGRFHMEGHRDDVAEWWKDKDFCLSTSMDEGCPYNVIEAAALGVQPIVHEYVGIRDQFPHAWRWDEPLDAAQKIVSEPPTSEANRDLVVSRYSLDAQADDILSVVERAAA